MTRIAALLFCLSTILTAPTAADEAQRVAFFEKRIRPALVQHCYKCHSAKAKSVKGGLLLDSRAALLKGGESGPAIVPGKPAESLLLAALKHESLEMPPDRKLPETVINAFEKWIRDGAVDPRSGTTGTQKKTIDWQRARKFWAFQPIRRWPLPPVKNSRWTRNAIDYFILDKLESNQLQPAAAADRLTLLRRASFDLIGLPPTPQQIERFLRDRSPLAYEHLIDRLLNSPQYGERWGRHWLDVARYADSNGSDENLNLPNAWRYRDYVIQSYNRDVPYDRFVTEQLAGDLLTARDATDQFRLWTATGFLVLGSKMLAEQDKQKMLADIVDEQVDTVSQALLGMTVGCARCHDHKFDPIPTTDYYALAGIFHSTKSMANQNFVSQWNERFLVDDETRALIEARKNKIQSLTKHRNALRDKLNASSKKTADRAEIEAAKKKVEEEIKELEKEVPKYPSAMAVSAAPARDVAVHIRGSHLNLAKKVTPRGFMTVTSLAVTAPAIPPRSSGRLELAQWLTKPSHPLTARVMVNRIWQGHFGLGLIPSPNNLGIRGQAPTHPRLLDWLSSEFVRRQWSIKAMHRLIMTSAVYRMRSAYDKHGATVDPANRLLWRQRRRRLEVEPIRDAILAVGGSLDESIGGSLSGDATPNYQRLKKDVFSATRRAVYLPINRSALYEMFSIFDYADASAPVGRRPTTTVSHQALFMLNSPMVLEQTRLLAGRILAGTDVLEERLKKLYLTLYGRPPRSVEVQTAGRYLAQVRGLAKGKTESKGQPAVNQELESWISLARVLMAANEFVYIN